jgi:hypothetical protein
LRVERGTNRAWLTTINDCEQKLISLGHESEEKSDILALLKEKEK